MVAWVLAGTCVAMIIYIVAARILDTRRTIIGTRATIADVTSSTYGKTDVAIKEIIDRFPNNIEPLLRWVDFSGETGDYDEAVKRAKFVFDRFPKDPRSIDRYAVALRRSGRRQEAEDLVSSAIKRLGAREDLFNTRASLAYNSGDHNLASERFREIRRRFPRNRDGYIWGAETFALLGQHDEAEKLLEEVIDGSFQFFGPQFVERYARYARARQDWAEADRRWRLLCEHAPFNADGYLGRSEALRHLGEWSKAGNVINSGMTFCPKDARLSIEATQISARSVGPGFQEIKGADVGEATAEKL